MSFLSSSPAWQLLSQSDWMTKCVLLFLFGLSVFCGWIVIEKILGNIRQKKYAKTFRAQIMKAQSIEEIVEISKRSRDFVGAKFLLQVLQELKRVVGDENNRLTKKELERIEMFGEQSIEHLISEEEDYLPVLGTSAAVAPLIGLFGTVWGLVHAFINISQEKSADIAVIAPGIAEALFTTLAGLFVAIPAVMFFHYFSNEIRKVEQQLFVALDKFVNIVEQKFVK
jgi:biopolymer transport protein TolQ